MRRHCQAWRITSGRNLVKTLRSNVIQMSEKSQKRPLSKNEDTSLYVILKKIITTDMTYTQTTTKQISLFNADERLKYPPLVHSLNFASYPILIFSILCLKFKLKSKL